MAATATQTAINPASLQQFVTCKEASQLLKLSEVSIRRFLTQKKLRRYKCGSRTLLKLSEVLGLVRVSES
jgi:excisionase family DNA binding protein